MELKQEGFDVVVIVDGLKLWNNSSIIALTTEVTNEKKNTKLNKTNKIITTWSNWIK